MANEITISALIACSNINQTLPQRGLDAVSFDQTGTNINQTTQNIAVTEEVVALGDTGTGGFVYIENLDRTNFVSIRPGTGAANLIKLKPATSTKRGDCCLFRIEIAPWAIADTAACDILVIALEA